MEIIPALALAGLGGFGLYVLGGIAVEQRRLTQAGHPKIDEYDEYDGRMSEDLVAFGVGMTVLGIIFQETPAMIDQASAMVRQAGL